MKKKFIIIGLVMSGLGFAQDSDGTCMGITKDSTNCKIRVTNQDFCRFHGGNKVEKIEIISAQCTENTSKGRRCRVKTKHISGICHHHRD
tara:strand:+ start:230 stop:499 length:270 start_codon:yes stop_codon:yes gene_type:complete